MDSLTTMDIMDVDHIDEVMKKIRNISPKIKPLHCHCCGRAYYLAYGHPSKKQEILEYNARQLENGACKVCYLGGDNG